MPWNECFCFFIFLSCKLLAFILWFRNKKKKWPFKIIWKKFFGGKNTRSDEKKEKTIPGGAKFIRLHKISLGIHVFSEMILCEKCIRDGALEFVDLIAPAALAVCNTHVCCSCFSLIRPKSAISISIIIISVPFFCVVLWWWNFDALFPCTSQSARFNVLFLYLYECEAMLVGSLEYLPCGHLKSQRKNGENYVWCVFGQIVFFFLFTCC